MKLTHVAALGLAFHCTGTLASGRSGPDPYPNPYPQGNWNWHTKSWTTVAAASSSTLPPAASSSQVASSSGAASSTGTSSSATSTSTDGGNGSGGSSGCHQLNFVGPGAPASTCIAGGTNPGFSIGGAGGTKVEIFAAAGGGSAGASTLNVLDVSLCDGYSVPVQCVLSGEAAAGSPLGNTAGSIDGLGPCPNNAAATETGGNCVNNESHNMESNMVDQFFQNSQYWFWDGDGKPHVNWIGWQTITCTIGGGSSTKHKRQAEMPSNETATPPDGLPITYGKGNHVHNDAPRAADLKRHVQHGRRRYARALSLFS